MSPSIALLAVLCLSANLLLFSDAVKLPIQDANYEINYNVSDKTIAFDVRAKTSGWVAIGINEKESDITDLFVGFVVAVDGMNSTAATGLDCKVASGVNNKHPFNCTEPQNWRNIRGQEITTNTTTANVTWTTLHFERDLKTDDKNNDVEIKKKKLRIFYFSNNGSDLITDGPSGAPGNLMYDLRSGSTATSVHNVAIGTLLVTLAVPFLKNGVFGR